MGHSQDIAFGWHLQVGGRYNEVEGMYLAVGIGSGEDGHFGMGRDSLVGRHLVEEIEPGVAQ